jgi:peroxiredoxin
VRAAAGKGSRTVRRRDGRGRGLAACGALLALAVLPLAAAAPVPRPAPALTIVDSAGRQMPLASLKGKVVAVEFLLTRCPHCWRLAQTISRLGQELGPRGFQLVGVAFDADISSRRLSEFATASRITLTLGSTTAENVDLFLGRTGNERFQVPQIVIIDRTGVIRAQSRPAGETNLEDEGYLRRLIGTLLDEGPPAAR